MRSLQITRPRLIEIIDAPYPSLPGKGWIIVRLIHALICGSDLPAFSGKYQVLNYPLQPGMFIHECTGEVAESTSNRFRPGDRVVAMPHECCGLSEYYPAPEDSAVRIPDVFDNAELAPLIQPLSTVLYAAEKLGDVTNQSVTILGGGPIGLMMTWILNMRGASPIRIIDPIRDRCEFAKTFGASATLAVTSTEARSLHRSNMLGFSEADICVEAVGHQQEVLNDAIAFVRSEGRLLVLGIPDQPVYALEYERLLRKNLQLIASVTPNWVDYMTKAAEILIQHERKLQPLITHRFDITSAAKAYSLCEARTDGVCKALLKASPENWNRTEE
jgi:threonine dehydrogenase-like Zn-dependent dehydrogenase